MSACYVENVRKVFPTKQGEFVALEDISFDVEEGEVYMITGPSRCGKTTLLSIIGGLLEPTSGTSTLHGMNLYNMDEKEAADFRLRHIGYVFQTPQLISSFTLLENLSVPLHLMGIRNKLAEERALEVIEQLGLLTHKDDVPDILSEAEKTLVAIGRALVLLPKILILDEPTSSLDHSSGVKILTHLRELAYDHQITVIAAITDVRLHPFADRVAKMRDGKIFMVSGEPGAIENATPFLKL